LRCIFASLATLAESPIGACGNRCMYIVFISAADTVSSSSEVFSKVFINHSLTFSGVSSSSAT
jgi:hypothetical protein